MIETDKVGSENAEHCTRTMTSVDILCRSPRLTLRFSTKTKLDEDVFQSNVLTIPEINLLVNNSKT